MNNELSGYVHVRKCLKHHENKQSTNYTKACIAGRKSELVINMSVKEYDQSNIDLK